MTGNEIRKAFLNFFKDKQHTILPSGSLVPGNDQTLLFTNAGMVQFKDLFLGNEKRSYTRAATVQRCVRAGGKHNDLENVGVTARHHTFFEMLGNFSFGDYFKRDAILYAWEFLTKVLLIPREKLWVTVFKDDTEAEKIWLEEVGIDPKRFSRCGEKDNFWSMGDTGPCGPCTEIFYDHGPTVLGGPPGTAEADGDRYIEIWNLVFMQYERFLDGHKEFLPAPSVDTGMGLERLAAILQGVHSNYETDLFLPLILEISKIADIKAGVPVSVKVLADHIRSASFLIADGVNPSNEGRGYVLRRILRRALKHGFQLGIELPFFNRLVPVFVTHMKEAYPELVEKESVIKQAILREEELFAKTLNQGMKILSDLTNDLKDKRIPGDVLFKLYDTYGFPVDLVGDIAIEKNLTLDLAGFEEHMQRQRDRARAASQFETDYTQKEFEETSEFKGYDLHSLESKVIGIYQAGQAVHSLRAGDSGLLVLERTPFYPEAGGQKGDRGVIKHRENIFAVLDTQKKNNAILHEGHLQAGEIKVGDVVKATVDEVARSATAANHSATHLLHAALRSLLGASVIQKGSYVGSDRLRFDFAYAHPLKRADLIQVEQLVNRKIRENYCVMTDIKTPEEAISAGAMALFGEKYAEKVRVLTMGDFSKELCGGTHVTRTGDIGFFKIVSEAGIAAGTRRIEALTAEAAVKFVEAQEEQLKAAAALLKTVPESLNDKIEQLQSQLKSADNTLAQLKSGEAKGLALKLLDSARVIKNLKVIAAEVPGQDIKSLREMVDFLRSKIGQGVVILACPVSDTKISLVAGVTKIESQTLHAGELVGFVAKQIGGKGGGRADLAEGGGEDRQALPQALAAVVEWVEIRIS